jgi:hypothetical protein
MKVHRWYVIVFGIAAAIAAYVVIPRIADSIRRADERAGRAKAAAALARLETPASYAPLSAADPNCLRQLSHCYRVEAPSVAFHRTIAGRAAEGRRSDARQRRLHDPVAAVARTIPCRQPAGVLGVRAPRRVPRLCHVTGTGVHAP